MIEPEIYKHEQERLRNLESYSILDTLPECDYDNLTAIAAEICNTPVALVSLIDNKRQWFKSHHGLDASETPKEHAFCAHAINDPESLFIIQDARTDERFHDNPLVTGDPFVIFYAGMPLVSDEGFPLGTLCVIDHKPKLLSQSQISSLKALSRQVINLFKLRKNKQLLENALSALEEKNQELESFAYVAAHDLKSPLVGISNMSQLLKDFYYDKFDAEGRHMLDLLDGSSQKLTGLIDGLLEYSKSETVLKEFNSIINLEELLKNISGLFAFDHDLKLSLNTELKEIYSNKTAIDQILINLIANAVKYSDKNLVEVEVGVSENNMEYEFYVRDNGPGILPEYHDRVFRIFEVLTAADKNGMQGNGIGLATVKKIVEKLDGSITLESEPGKGAKFIFTLKK